MPSPALIHLDLGIHDKAPPLRRASVSHLSVSAKEEQKSKLTGIEAAKQLAAWTAVDRHVLPEHQVIGIGSGSTVPYVVERIVAQGKAVNKDRVFIPTGFQSKELIVQAGLRLGDVDQYPTIDVTIDGADEVDAELNCIKGGGACHLREKVLAEAAETFIVVADYRKKTETLGTAWKQGVPIEVAPFAYAKLLQNLHRLGSPSAKLRMAVAKAGPVVSDNGNFVIDAPFDEQYMKHPFELLSRIKMLTGVVEVGLFCNMAKAAYFGEGDGSVTVRLGDGSLHKIESESSSSAQEAIDIEKSKNPNAQGANDLVQPSPLRTTANAEGLESALDDSDEDVSIPKNNIPANAAATGGSNLDLAMNPGVGEIGDPTSGSLSAVDRLKHSLANAEGISR